MKIRRLDREYADVQKAEIKTDANKFEGLAKVLGIDKAAQEEDSEDKENTASPNNNAGEDEDGFGDFQEAEGGYAEIGSVGSDGDEDN